MPALLKGAHLDGVRVLVVDDHPDSRELLCELLARFGAECASAEDVPRARAALTTFKPHVVVSDIGMPGEDGYALIRWGHAQPSPPFPPPLIAVTASEQTTTTRAAGFVAQVKKPIEISVLLDAIASAIGRVSQP